MSYVTVPNGCKFPLALSLVTVGSKFILFDLDNQSDINKLFQIKELGLCSIRHLYSTQESDQGALYISEDSSWEFTIIKNDSQELQVAYWKYIGPAKI